MISKSVLSKDFPLIIDFQIFFLELHSVLEGGHSDFSQIEPFLYQTVPSYVTRNGGKNFREI